MITRLSQLKVLRKYMGRPYLLANQWIWRHLPSSLISSDWGRWYGRHCHELVRLQGHRRMSIGTLFLRNRPELACLCRLLDDRPQGSSLSILVLACSKGAEVYSISYAIRSARPDLKLTIHAVDISDEVVEIARHAHYSLQSLNGMSWPDPSLIAKQGQLAWNTWRGQDESIFERMTPSEIESLFDRQGDQVQVKPQFREGISWLVGDAADPELARRVGTHDLVMAKNFLCHMAPPQADACLRTLPCLVNPGGFLFVSGVDVEVRAKVASDLGWKPVTGLIREVHEGDPSLRSVWPWNYCGLEPFDESRHDWKFRYAAIFQIGEASEPIPVHA